MVVKKEDESIIKKILRHKYISNKMGKILRRKEKVRRAWIMGIIAVISVILI